MPISKLHKLISSVVSPEDSGPKINAIFERLISFDKTFAALLIGFVIAPRTNPLVWLDVAATKVQSSRASSIELTWVELCRISSPWQENFLASSSR